MEDYCSRTVPESRRHHSLLLVTTLQCLLDIIVLNCVCRQWRLWSYAACSVVSPLWNGDDTEEEKGWQRVRNIFLQLCCLDTAFFYWPRVCRVALPKQYCEQTVWPQVVCVVLRIPRMQNGHLAARFSAGCNTHQRLLRFGTAEYVSTCVFKWRLSCFISLHELCSFQCKNSRKVQFRLKKGSVPHSVPLEYVFHKVNDEVFFFRGGKMATFCCFQCIWFWHVWLFQLRWLPWRVRHNFDGVLGYRYQNIGCRWAIFGYFCSILTSGSW